jgi:quercetin dioxygenase-like cupin family protein
VARNKRLVRRHLLNVCTSVCALGLFAMANVARAADETAMPVFQKALPNVPGKKLVAVRVDYGPGAKSAAHHHAPSAFVFAYVISGEIRSQVGDAPARVYKAGESFYENPGSEHRISENASDTESASLLAVFVVDSGDNHLTIPLK